MWQDKVCDARSFATMSGVLTGTTNARPSYGRNQPKVPGTAPTGMVVARYRELLSTNYFHVVFTVPHEVNGFARASPAEFYNLLFAASSETLLEVAADSRVETPTQCEVGSMWPFGAAI
jgi:hypothetical protein